MPTIVSKPGAAIAHIHVRYPESGMRSGDANLFREVFNRIKDSGSDILINLLINLTSSEGGRFIPGDVDAHIGGPGTTLLQPVRHRVLQQMSITECHRANPAPRQYQQRGELV